MLMKTQAANSSDRPALVPVRAAFALRQYTLLQAYRMNVVCVLAGIMIGFLISAYLAPELNSQIGMVALALALACSAFLFIPFRDPRADFNTDCSTVHIDNLLVLSEREMEIITKDMKLTPEDIKRTQNFVTVNSSGNMGNVRS